MKTITLKSRKRITVVIGILGAVILSVVVIFGAGQTASAEKTVTNRVSGTVPDDPLASVPNRISVSLVGATRYRLTEVFNDILKAAPGVIESRQTRLHMEPENPGACHASWEVLARDTSPFQLESDIYAMIRKVANAEGEVETLVLSFQPDNTEKKLLSLLRPFEASSREIRFHFLYLTPGYGNDRIIYKTGRKVFRDAGFE